jgi:Uma2 family endonuclease
MVQTISPTISPITSTISLEQFLKLPETKPANELIDGNIIQKPMPKGKHSRIQQKLATAINAILEVQKIAIALPELRCSFGDRSVVPDIAVFSWANIPIGEDGDLENNFFLPPDWTIEILSPDQSVTRVMLNIMYCLDRGSQMGWLIDPAEQIIIIYQPNQSPVAISSSAQMLLVPDFAEELQISLGQIFDWLKVG